MATDRLEIDLERFDGWLRRLVDDHPGALVTHRDEPGGAATTVTWPDGGAECGRFDLDPLILVLIRRGGYAVGVAEGGELVAAKVGRRRVQGRTAAGGWSQQRYARRRANQADHLVDAVAGHAATLATRQAPAALVLGGDRRLGTHVLADPRLEALTGLPRRELPDLPDPSARVLAVALRRARTVWVRFTTPARPVEHGRRDRG
ncbi:MAG: hypothetical protein CSA84_01755 [Actinomycetales bacterium]|nr:MAG: hypothetical protein CSA84_01755 [Actinomycetales bacterium]